MFGQKNTRRRLKHYKVQLVLPRKDRHWRLATDASIVAMGAVLSQYDDDNIEHPIGYYSRKLIDSETRWSIWELELGAIYALQTVPSWSSFRAGI